MRAWLALHPLGQEVPGQERWRAVVGSERAEVLDALDRIG